MSNITENKTIKQAVNRASIFFLEYFRMIIIVVIIIIIALGLLFFIKPKYKSIVSKRMETSAPEDLVKYEERVKYSKELEKKLSDFKEIKDDDIKRIKALAPVRLYHEELLAQLEKIILENGLLLNSATIGEEGSGEKDKINSPEPGSLAAVSENDLQLKKIKISLRCI